MTQRHKRVDRRIEPAQRSAQPMRVFDEMVVELANQYARQIELHGEAAAFQIEMHVEIPDGVDPDTGEPSQ